MFNHFTKETLFDCLKVTMPEYPMWDSVDGDFRRFLDKLDEAGEQELILELGNYIEEGYTHFAKLITAVEKKISYREYVADHGGIDPEQEEAYWQQVDAKWIDWEADPLDHIAPRKVGKNEPFLTRNLRRWMLDHWEFAVTMGYKTFSKLENYEDHYMTTEWAQETLKYKELEQVLDHFGIDRTDMVPVTNEYMGTETGIFAFIP